MQTLVETEMTVNSKNEGCVERSGIGTRSKINRCELCGGKKNQAGQRNTQAVMSKQQFRLKIRVYKKNEEEGGIAVGSFRMVDQIGLVRERGETEPN